jgi:hypothetical protein
MSLVAPPRPSATSATPYAESQAQPVVRRASPDWLPVIGWFVEDGLRHSRVNVIPLGNTIDPHERFVTKLKFFRGGEEPVWTYLSDPFGGDQTFRFEGRELLRALGASSFEGLVEITARSLDRQPGLNHFPWIDSWLEFYADDGSLSGSVPGFVFKGGTTKRVMSGKWQHWPGIASNSDYASAVLLLNYHPRPTEVRFDVFAPSGLSSSSAVVRIEPRLPRTFDLEDEVPSARRLLEPEGGFGSLRIWSAYKLPGFVLMRNRASGAISSFDHTVPFAGPPID